MKYTIETFENFVEVGGDEFSRLWSEATANGDRESLRRLYSVALSFSSLGDEAFEDEELSEELVEEIG